VRRQLLQLQVRNSVAYLRRFTKQGVFSLLLVIRFLLDNFLASQTFIASLTDALRGSRIIRVQRQDQPLRAARFTHQPSTLATMMFSIEDPKRFDTQNTGFGGVVPLRACGRARHRRREGHRTFHLYLFTFCFATQSQRGLN
jgi:hypothetical protein